MAVVDLAKQVGTTKGDLYVYNGSTLVRLAAGTNDHVLTADAAESAGVKWAAAGAGSGTTWLDPVPSGNAPGGTDDDEFDNATIGTTAVLAGGSATWTESGDVLSVVCSGQTAAQLASQVKALTSPTTGLVVEAAFRLSTFAASSAFGIAGVVLSDGATTAADTIWAGLKLAGDGATAIDVRVGTLGSISFSASTGFRNLAGWVFVRLVWAASNSFNVLFSSDGVTWVTVHSGVAKTLTPTHMGVAASNFGSSQNCLATFEYLRAS